jgi:putative SOS response-associated peptidase YedK
MGKKFVLVSNLEKIESRFHVQLNPYTIPISVSYAVEVGDKSYIITSENPHELQVIKFGMTPYWAKTRMNLINARSEGDKNRNDDPYYNGAKSIFLKAAFKKPIQSQRCMVIADAYFEWSADKKPYLIYLQNKERPFAFAGMYDRWKNPESGEMLVSFAIITTTANSLLQSIGLKRMPVILSKSNETDWIKSTHHLSELLAMMNQFPSEKMNAYPVSEMVNTSGINEACLVSPVGEKLQSEEQPTRLIRQYRMHKEITKTEMTWPDRTKK